MKLKTQFHIKHCIFHFYTLFFLFTIGSVHATFASLPLNSSFFPNLLNDQQTICASKLQEMRKNPDFYRSIWQIIASDPFCSDAIQKQRDLFAFTRKSNLRQMVLDRLLLANIKTETEINAIWEIWAEKWRNSTFDFYIPAHSRSFAFDSFFCLKETDKVISNYPFMPEDLAHIAKEAAASGKPLIAREAIGRLEKMGQEQHLDNDEELFILKCTTERPEVQEYYDKKLNQVATAAIFLFKTNQKDKAVIKLYNRIILSKHNSAFRTDNSLIPADILEFIYRSIVGKRTVAYYPVLKSDDGILLTFSGLSGPQVTLIGQFENNKLILPLTAIIDNSTRIVDSPEVFWAVRLLIGELGGKIVVKKEFNSDSDYVNANLGLKTRVSKDRSISDDFLLTTSAIFSVFPPWEGNILEFEYIRQTYKGDSKIPEWSFSFTHPTTSISGSLNQLYESNNETAEAFNRLITRLITRPVTFSLATIISESSASLESAEQRWLLAAAIKEGLPVGNELRKLLRLYKIIGAPLPDRISLRMPLLFRANFVNPRRPEGEFDMVSGYWFDELELLVIADFDTDTGSSLGRFAAESVGLKGELAAEEARIVLYDGFNFKNHGLRLAIPAENKAGDVIAAELEKHQIKTSEDSMMLENPEAYRFFASISDRVYFILSEKDKPLQMRFAEEPER